MNNNNLKGTIFIYIYRFINCNNKTIYIGITDNIDRRIEQSHFTNIGHLPLQCYLDTSEVQYMAFDDICYIEAEIIESLLIDKYKPLYNKEINKTKNILNSKFITLNGAYLVENWSTYKIIEKEVYLKRVAKKQLKESGNRFNLKITEEEYFLIINHLNEKQDYRAKAIITIAYKLGLRASEIIQITTDICQHKKLTFKSHGILKVIVFHDDVINTINEYIKVRIDRPTNALFTSKTGKSGAINRQTVDSIVKKAFTELGLDMAKASIDNIRQV